MRPAIFVVRRCGGRTDPDKQEEGRPEKEKEDLGFNEKQNSQAGESSPARPPGLKDGARAPATRPRASKEL